MANLKSEERINFLTHYINKHNYHYNTAGGLVARDFGCSFDMEFLDKYDKQILDYMYKRCVNKTQWADTLIGILENGRPDLNPRLASNPIINFMFWFLVSAYVVGGDTNLEKLRRHIHDEHKHIVSLGEAE